MKKKKFVCDGKCTRCKKIIWLKGVKGRIKVCNNPRSEKYMEAIGSVEDEK